MTVTNDTTVTLLFEQWGQFKGDFPDISLPDDIDSTALGEQTFFVTLPIGKVNARSRNGRQYTKQAVESLVRQVNEQRPEGRWGHLDAAELGTRYDPPALRWLAATLDANGTAWGKAVPLTEQAREHFRMAKATNARVGTSVFGIGAATEGDRVNDFELLSIDIADPARVGVPMTAAHPKITREMGESEETMSDINETLLSEMRNERDAARQQVGALEQQVQALRANEQIVSELRGLVGKDDVVAELRGLVAEITELRGKALAYEIDAIIREEVKLEGLRPVVREMLGAVVSGDAARARVKSILEQESVVAIAKALTVADMGPAVLVSDGTSQMQDTPQARAAARAKFGF